MMLHTRATSGTIRLVRLAVLAATLVALAGTGLRADGAVWTVRRGTVRVTCPLTVGGSFEAKTTAVTGQVGAPGTAANVIVDVTTLDSGIDLRTEHLKRDYLEVGKGEAFTAAAITDIVLTGIDAQNPNGRGTFAGTLRLHGQSHPVRGKAEIKRSGTSLQIRAEFPVAISTFEIPTPRYMGVGVRDEVLVRVDLEAGQP